MTKSQKGRKAYVERKVGRVFSVEGTWTMFKKETHVVSVLTDFYKETCTELRDEPAPNSKAKTDGEEEKTLKRIRQQRRKLFRQKEQNSVPIQKIIHHVNVGLPCVKTTSLRPDANLEEHVSSDMMRLRRSPARSQRKVVRKDQLHY